MQPQYWPQPSYAQPPYVQQQQQQQPAPYAPQYNPYYQHQQAYQPGFRAGGAYDYSSDYNGHAFDTRSAGTEDRRTGGARGVLPPKARAWQHKVTHYAKTHGITLKQAMIRLKGTGVGKSHTKRKSRSRSRSRN